jgi:hypothetical protein
LAPKTIDKILGPVLSYQLNSTANLAHLPRSQAKRLVWQGCLAGSCKMVPRFFIFSAAMGAKPSFYMKFIAT